MLMRAIRESHERFSYSSRRSYDSLVLGISQPPYHDWGVAARLLFVAAVCQKFKIRGFPEQTQISSSENNFVKAVGFSLLCWINKTPTCILNMPTHRFCFHCPVPIHGLHHGRSTIAHPRMSVTTDNQLAKRERSAIVRPQQAARLLRGPEAVFGIILAGTLGIFRVFTNIRSREEEEDKEVQELGQVLGVIEELERLVERVQKERSEGKDVDELETQAKGLVRMVRERLRSNYTGNLMGGKGLPGSPTMLLQQTIESRDKQIENLEREKQQYADRATEMDRNLIETRKKAEDRLTETMESVDKLKQAKKKLNAQWKEKGRQWSKKIDTLEQIVKEQDTELRELKDNSRPVTLPETDNRRSDAALNEVTKNVEAETLALGAHVKRAEARKRRISGKKAGDIRQIDIESEAEKDRIRAAIKKAEATVERAEQDGKRRKSAVQDIFEFVRSNKDEEKAGSDKLEEVPNQIIGSRAEGTEEKVASTEAEQKQDIVAKVSSAAMPKPKRKRGRPRKNPE